MFNFFRFFLFLNFLYVPLFASLVKQDLLPEKYDLEAAIKEHQKKLNTLSNEILPQPGEPLSSPSLSQRFVKVIKLSKQENLQVPEHIEILNVCYELNIDEENRKKVEKEYIESLITILSPANIKNINNIQNPEIQFEVLSSLSELLKLQENQLKSLKEKFIPIPKEKIPFDTTKVLLIKNLTYSALYFKLNDNSTYHCFQNQDPLKWEKTQGLHCGISRNKKFVWGMQNNELVLFDLEHQDQPFFADMSFFKSKEGMTVYDIISKNCVFIFDRSTQSIIIADFSESETNPRYYFTLECKRNEEKNYHINKRYCYGIAEGSSYLLFCDQKSGQYYKVLIHTEVVHDEVDEFKSQYHLLYQILNNCYELSTIDLNFDNQILTVVSSHTGTKYSLKIENINKSITPTKIIVRYQEHSDLESTDMCWMSSPNKILYQLNQYCALECRYTSKYFNKNESGLYLTYRKKNGPGSKILLCSGTVLNNEENNNLNDYIFIRDQKGQLRSCGVQTIKDLVSEILIQGVEGYDSNLLFPVDQNNQQIPHPKFNNNSKTIFAVFAGAIGIGLTYYIRKAYLKASAKT